MNATVLLVAIVVFAFVVGRALDRFASRLLLFSGAEYVVLGAILGAFLRAETAFEELAAIDLLVSTVLGVVGFFVGLQVRHIKAGTEAMLSGLGASLGIIAVVAIAATEAFEVLEPTHAQSEPIVAVSLGLVAGRELWLWVTPAALWVGLSIGAAAGSSSTAAVEIATARFGVSDARSRLLHGMATASELLAVFAFGMAMASSRASTVTGTLGLTLTEWALVTILAGACTGLLFTVFIGREDDRMRMNVATIGVIVFAAGVGTALGVSPLLVNLIAGLTVALIYPNAERLETALGPLRFPTSVLVLLFAGLTWVPVSGLLWAFIPGYAALRVVARLFFSRLAAATFFPDKAAAVGIGRGLLAQGVVAGAISLAFAQRFPQSADIVTTTILGGLVLTDVLAMRSLRRYLADVGEIRALGETDKERI